MSITIQQIEAFITVAEHLNLSEAADRMFMSHSALSKTIKRFELSLGVQLFIRENRGMSITPEGNNLYALLREPYRSVASALDTVINSQRIKSSQINVGFPDSYYYIPYYNIIKESITKFCNIKPSIEINETIHSYDDLMMSLIGKGTDIIIGQTAFLERIKDVEVLELFSSTSYIVIAKDHPLAVFDSIAFHQLENLTLYVIKVADENEQRKNINTMCKNLNFSPKDVVIVPNTFSLLHAINAGKGVALFAKVDNLTTSMSLKYYPFPNEFGNAAKVKIGAVWFPHSVSEDMRCFLDILKVTAAESDYYEQKNTNGRSLMTDNSKLPD